MPRGLGSRSRWGKRGLDNLGDIIDGPCIPRCDIHGIFHPHRSWVTIGSNSREEEGPSVSPYPPPRPEVDDIIDFNTNPFSEEAGKQIRPEYLVMIDTSSGELHSYGGVGGVSLGWCPQPCAAHGTNKAAEAGQGHETQGNATDVSAGLVSSVCASALTNTNVALPIGTKALSLERGWGLTLWSSRWWY